MAPIKRPLALQPGQMPQLPPSNTPLQYGNRMAPRPPAPAQRPTGLSLSQYLGGAKAPNPNPLSPPPSLRPAPRPTSGDPQFDQDRMPQDFGIARPSIAPQTPQTGGPLFRPQTGGGLQIPNSYIPYQGNREDIKRR